MRSFFFLLISAAASAQAAPPARLEIAYELMRDGSKIAEIVQKLEHGQGKYRITESWEGRGVYRLFGNAKRLSRGEVAREGLRPIEYSDERTGRETEHALFDWAAKTVTYRYKGPPKTLPMPPNPRDSLQFLFQFSFRPPRGEQVLDVISGRGISDQVYKLEGRERIKVPAGEFDAVKMVRRKDNGERAEIWLAADRSYLPVRILVVTKNGTLVDQIATRLSTP